MASAAAAAAAAPSAAAAAPSWRNQRSATQGSKRFKQTAEQKKQARRLYEHMPRIQQAITKMTNASGQQALAIVSDRLQKRPEGNRSKKTDKLKHTTATFHAIATSDQAATGVDGAQAKQVLAGQLRALLSEIEQPTTRVKFVKPARARKVAVAAADGDAKDALMDTYHAILAEEP